MCIYADDKITSRLLFKIPKIMGEQWRVIFKGCYYVQNYLEGFLNIKILKGTLLKPSIMRSMDNILYIHFNAWHWNSGFPGLDS